MANIPLNNIRSMLTRCISIFHESISKELIITCTGYKLVSIVQQQSISAETLEIKNLSDLLVGLSETSPANIWPPKGGGGSFPGGKNNLPASFRVDSATSATYHLQFLWPETAQPRLHWNLPSSRPWKVSFRWALINNKIFCIIKDQLSSSPLDFGNNARQWASFWLLNTK